MVKKLSAVSQRFSMAAKQVRVMERKTREAEKALDEKTLDGSIFPLDILDSRSNEMWIRMVHVQWDGKLIAALWNESGSPFVEVQFMDCLDTRIQIRNVQACRSLLTVRKVAAALMLPYGTFKLVELVRQCDAEADAEQLRVAIEPPVATSKSNRL
jgi:hypothetical protein